MWSRPTVGLRGYQVRGLWPGIAMQGPGQLLAGRGALDAGGFVCEFRRCHSPLNGYGFGHDAVLLGDGYLAPVRVLTHAAGALS